MTPELVNDFPSEQHDHVITKRIQSRFRILCSQLPNVLHFCFGDLQDDISDNEDMSVCFHQCESDIYSGMSHLVFHGPKPDLPDVHWSPIQAPENIDLDFNVSWTTCMRFVVPLDPYLDIGPHDWKEKGILREYYACRNKLVPRSLSCT